MNARKLGGLMLLVFVLFYAITNPTESAAAVRAIAIGIGAFASALAGGGG